MTAITKKPENPIAHLTPGGHRADRLRARRDPPGRHRRARRGRREVHPPGDQRAAAARARQPGGAAGIGVPARVGGRHGRPEHREDPREHGDRPQRPARPVGLDARPEDPLDDLGVGHGHARRAVAALPQPDPPHVHEHRRQGQRPRLRHHARRRGPALAPDAPRPAALEPHQRLLLRVRHRGLRPRARGDDQEEADQGPRVPAPAQGRADQDPPPGHQGLRRPPGAVAAHRLVPADPGSRTSPPTWSATCGRTR